MWTPRPLCGGRRPGAFVPAPLLRRARAGRAPPSTPSPRPGPGAPSSSPPASARGGDGAGAAPTLAGVGGAVARPAVSAELHSARAGSAEGPGNSERTGREARSAAEGLRFGEAWEGTSACPPARAPLLGARRASAGLSPLSLSVATSPPLSPPPSLLPFYLFPSRLFLLYIYLSTSVFPLPLTPSFYMFLSIYLLFFSPSFYEFLISSLVLVFTCLLSLYCCLPPSSLPFRAPTSSSCAGAYKRVVWNQVFVQVWAGGVCGWVTAQLATFPTCARVYTHSLSSEFAGSSPPRPVRRGP